MNPVIIVILVIIGMLMVAFFFSAFAIEAEEERRNMAREKKKGIYPTLCMGAKGDLVVQMQELLAKWGSSVQPSGHFNIGTRTALLKFQNEKGLEIDGVCGPETWKELLKYAHIKFVEPKAAEEVKAEPEPELTMEQKVDILWKEHLKGGK